MKRCGQRRATGRFCNAARNCIILTGGRFGFSIPPVILLPLKERVERVSYFHYRVRPIEPTRYGNVSRHRVANHFRERSSPSVAMNGTF